MLISEDRGHVAQFDPLRWPEWVQWPVLAVLISVPFVGMFLDNHVLAATHWVVISLSGTLIWRYEGHRYRVIATWTVPLGLAVLIAYQFPGLPFLVVANTALGILSAMLFSTTARHGWVAFVAPGEYRTLPKSDRDVIEQVDNLDRDLGSALRDAERSGYDVALQRRLEALAAKMRAISAPDADWERIRTLWLDYVALLVDVLQAEAASDDTYRELDARREAFDAASRQLQRDRSYPLTRSRPL